MEPVTTRLSPTDLALVEAAAVEMRTTRTEAIRRLLVDATRQLLFERGAEAHAHEG